MNDERRKRIDRIKERIEGIVAELSEIRDEVVDVQSEEQQYLDAMPENMASGERAERAQSAIDNLEGALDELDVESGLNDALESLESAKE